MGSFHGCFTCSHHILVCGKAPPSILAQQTACGQVTACSGSAGRVFVQPWTPQAPTFIFPLVERRAPATTGRKLKPHRGTRGVSVASTFKNAAAAVCGSLPPRPKRRPNVHTWSEGLPDHPRCVPEDRGCEALGDPHQAGPIHLHDLVVHFDSGPPTNESRVNLFDYSEIGNVNKKETARRETNKAAYRFTLVVKLERRSTLLQSHVSTAALPDCCITKRQKRRGTKQSGRTNEDTRDVP